MSAAHHTVCLPRRASADPFHRYRRTVLQPTVISKDGGTTVVDARQLAALAHDLNRDVSTLVTHIKRECGAATRVTGDGAMHVRKRLTTAELDDIVEAYVEDHVVCDVCDNPETSVRGGHTLSCRACGAVRVTRR